MGARRACSSSSTREPPLAPALSVATLLEVALPLPLRQTFTYGWDGATPAPGTRVMVPFRNRIEVGWVLGPGEPVPRVRKILSVLEPRPSVAPDLIRLARWLAEYYVAPLGQVLRAMVPGPMVDRSTDHLVARRDAGPGDDLSARERAILEAVADRSAGRAASSVKRVVGRGSFWPQVRRLEDLGILGHETVPPRPAVAKTRRVVVLTRTLGTLDALDALFGRSHRQREAYDALLESGGRMPLAAMLDTGFSRSVIGGLIDKEVAVFEEEAVHRDPFSDIRVPPPPTMTPTGQQREVVEALDRSRGSGRAALLHGVTGSGKTLVYVELLRRALDAGEGAIVLVPEIALTPQTVERFRQAFGDLISVLHSGLSDGERYDAWRSLRDGTRRVAIGARSAVFAPVPSLGVVIVDEEHDGSYKQSEAPRYHGRDVAVVRAKLAGALCVLGSATPSLESWMNAKGGKYDLYSLPDRVGGGVLPEVRVVDLRTGPGAGEGTREERRGSAPGGGGSDRILSPRLEDAIGERLRRREQIVVLLNRRGYASFALCLACGDVMACIHCSVSMTYHRGRRRMLCHHCGHEDVPPERCSRCGSDELSFRGLGTEQVERVLMEAFPEARLARMDMDTTGGKWSHQEILDRVGSGAVDILLGTQMIAKGLDFPRVTLVGVINADVGLHLPDFRASERTFQLLAQVAGRAGRGTLGGEVIIQTFVPDHYVILAASSHDYRGFVERELKVRMDPPYPPHTRMARVLVSSPAQEQAVLAAEALGRWLVATSGGAVAVLGPAPAPIERLHGRYRWHVLLRGGAAGLGRVLVALVEGFNPPGSDVRLGVDRDPVHLL